MTNFTRRDFLKIGAAGTATAVLAGCSQKAEHWVTLEPYVDTPPEGQRAGIPTFYATTCRQCPAGCGIVAKVLNGRAVKIEGSPEHPVSRGKVCARGQAGLQLLYNPDRVTGAVTQANRGERKFKPIAWNEAFNTLFEKLQSAGDAVGVWVGSTTSGHLVDLFARFTQAIGAPAPVRYDLYSGLNGYDVLAAASGNLFGQAGLPTYDVSHADVVFSFGADFLGTWFSAVGYGVEFGQFRSQMYGKRGYLVQFEPKMSVTGAKADRWVPVRPGAEALVAQALVRIIADQGFGPADRVDRAKALAGEVSLDEAAAACDLPVDELTRLARIFAEADHPLAIPGGPLSGQNGAIAATMAVQALNVIAGTIGQPGGMSITPDLPVTNLLAPPASTFADVQKLIASMNAGEIKVLLVHGANPAYDLPQSAGFMDALNNVETIVSFNSMVDETSAYADFILPDRVYLEGWGYDVVRPGFQGLPVVGSQQPVVPPLYDIYSTGDVLLTVTKGIPKAAAAFPWQDEVAFLKEMISGLPKGAAGGDDVEVRWARFQQHGGWWPESAPSGTLPQPTATGPIAVEAAAYQGDEQEYPYYLHLYLSVLLSDGTGANSPWLQGSPDPMTTISWQTWVEVSPTTAQDLDLEDGNVVRIISPYGEIEVPVYVFPAIRPDTVAIPLGQGHSDYGRYARERGSNALALVGEQTGGTDNNLLWSNVRVKIEKTGAKKALARLESSITTDPEMLIPF
ncbi:MAG TPA: molybdopterin-dependent oxidoreductase [Aggregatilineaceae bacterium]|nr:molybdopterin-dependent oxidoreductase [Aggregatilineaceae bacterium]